MNVIAASSLTNFILVIHGADDGSGLWLKLVPSQRKPGTSHFDLQRLLEVSTSGEELSRRDEEIMGITQADSLRVREALLKLQFKTIDGIEFRSCNLGRNLLSLDRFRRFFGARMAGAPDVHTFFGDGPPLIGPNFRDAHKRSHFGVNWETYNFPSAYKAPELVCCFKLNGLGKPESAGHVGTGTRGTLNAWIRQHLAPTGGYAGGNLALHGLWLADRLAAPGGGRFVPAAVELDAEQTGSPLGGWGGPALRRMILPLSEMYSKHIVYSR